MDNIWIQKVYGVKILWILKGVQVNTRVKCFLEIKTNYLAIYLLIA